MQLGSGRAVIPLSAADPGQSHAWGPGKFDFFCSKGILFIHFYIKFSAAWGIFVHIRAGEIITIHDF